MKGRFAVTAGPPLRRATDAKRQQQREQTKKKKAALTRSPKRETPTIVEEPATPESPQEPPKEVASPPSPTPSPAPSSPRQVAAEKPPAPTKQDLVEQYEILANEFQAALAEREELRRKDQDLTLQIAAAYREQAKLEKQIQDQSK